MEFAEPEIVFAPHSEGDGYYAAVQAQRQAGQVVICGMPGQAIPEGVERVLVQENGRWCLRTAGQG